MADKEALSEQRLQEIRERAEKATKGSWTIRREDGDRYLEGETKGFGALMCDTQYYPWTPEREEDWQFIAHARQDIPDLLAELTRSRAALLEMEQRKTFNEWEKFNGTNERKAAGYSPDETVQAENGMAAASAETAGEVGAARRDDKDTVESLRAALLEVERQLAKAKDILGEIAAYGDCQCGDMSSGALCEVCEARAFIAPAAPLVEREG